MPSPAATVVLIAHGSRVTEANETHRRLAAELGERSGQEVIAAYLELADPDIPSALDQAVEAGASRVLVLPYFLLPGAHTKVDIPALVDAARERHPEVHFDQLDHLGADPAIVDILATQVDAASR